MLQKIKELRERTNISLDRCKKALEQTNGNINEAIVVLQKQGLVDAVKKSGRTANEGVIHSYVHMGKIGVLVEVNCETDFAAKSPTFLEFVDQVALQIASMDPVYISKNDVPHNLIHKQLEIAKSQTGSSLDGKPEQVVNKILDGKLSKWFAEICLLEQVSVVMPKKSIEELRTELVSKIGENVVVKRFVRWELGQSYNTFAREPVVGALNDDDLQKLTKDTNE